MTLEEKIDLVNRRLKTMLDTGYDELTVNKIMAKQIRMILGYEFDHYFVPDDSEVPDKKKRQFEEILDKFIASDWTTEEGRQRIYDKRLESFKQNNNLNEEEVLKIYDIFATSAYHTMIEKRMLDSRQFIDLIKRNQEVELRNIEQGIDALNKSGVDKKRSRMFLQNFFKKRQ